MTKNTILKYATINSLLTTLYITLVGTFLINAQGIFGEHDPILIPIAMMLLLVLSATITSALVLGRPLLWYLDGNKKDALTLLGYTVACLFIITVLVFFAMFLMSK